MPMSRYEIRNEYNLADPELYRTADKDDPEALLEGVAMSGLVGVLRQLGDLAEFAAEIFHNLHEEVMATAARGHDLTIRAQQLESEIPSIERAFLSQTDHSSFFYHTGVDWHPNLRMDQNVVTQGDLPRFIMDSYEECRAPPRLFLLDKFDVAGAGACLKRYTDPSFFKVETSEMTGAYFQREKKSRKTKKKVPRWRNGETPEVLPTSHTKLHQLFLEERVENGVSKPSFRAKLKRRLNGFPFDSKTGKSYMEKLLKPPSPVHKVLHKVTVNSSLVKSDTDDHKDCGFDIFEVRPVSPNRASGRRKKGPPSPEGEQYMLNSSIYDPSEPLLDDKLCEVPYSYPSIATDGFSFTLDKVSGERVVTVNSETSVEGCLTGYLSDDIASEIDNYVDAPSTMESEMDGDSEMRVKSDITSSYLKHESLISDADKHHLHNRSSDSQSAGGSTLSDDRNNSSNQEISSVSSDSPITSAEDPQAGNFCVKGFRCANVPVNEIVDQSSYQKTADEDLQVDHRSKHVVSDDTCTETDAITNHRFEFELLTSSLGSNGSLPNLAHSDTEEVVRKHMLETSESDEMVSTLDDEEKKINLAIDPPCSPSLDDSSGSSAGEHLGDEPNGESLHSLSTIPDFHWHTPDSAVKASTGSIREDESDGKDQNLSDDIVFTSNMLNVLPTNGIPDTLSSEILIPGKFKDELSDVPEIIPSDYPVAAHDGDNIESGVSKEDNLIDASDDDNINGGTDSSNHFPCITEASVGKKFEETSLASAQTVNVEDGHSNSSTYSHISTENIKLSDLANSPDRPMEGLDAHKGDDIHKKKTTINENLELETPEPCEVVGLQAVGITQHVFPNDAVDLDNSCCNPNLEEPSRTEDTVEMNIISLCLSSSGREVTEISGCADLNSVNDVHILLDKPDSEANKSDTTNMISTVPAVSDVASPNKLVEELSNCFEEHSGVDELENDEKCSSECHEESDILEKVCPTEASGLGVGTVFCNTVNIGHPISTVSDIIPNSHLDLEVAHRLAFVHVATIESPVEHCGIAKEQELCNEIGLGNHFPEAVSLPVGYGTDESIAQEQIELPCNQLDQVLLHPGEITAELSPLLPINHQQMLNHDDCKQDNDYGSALSLVGCRSPPSFSELSSPSNHVICVPGFPKDPLVSILPPSNHFSETNQMNLADLPPLPPLPPVEWRMGKLQHTSSSTEGKLMKHEKLFPQLVSPLTVPSDDSSPPSPPPTTSTDDVCSSAPTASTNDINCSLEEMKHSLTEIGPETASKEENTQNSSSSFEFSTLHETTDLPVKTVNKQQQIIPISESVFASPAEEDGVDNGTRTVKLPRPRNPLIDDVAVLDKSKLRKVTERARSEIQIVDERDSLLQKIRTKSFNLKPALASRPSIRGPNTNLKVVAILEKANAIRQACAGSDEDDSDSWSDS